MRFTAVSIVAVLVITALMRIRVDQAQEQLERLSERISVQKKNSLDLARNLAEMRQVIDAAARDHRRALDEVAALRDHADQNLNQLHKEVLYPSVQVSGRTGVGGGVIFHSRDSETYVITAFHVVQKLVRKDGRDPVEVRFYDKNGKSQRTMEGEIVLYDKQQDVALVRVAGTGRMSNVAKLASRETLSRIRVFTPIYAVGCPLGHDPMPSPGEISTLHKEVDGKKFWMMNAPTIFGNSGGGIFLRETGELAGISAMICTYEEGSMPVPHLGIMVSLETLYDWLDENHYQFLYDENYTSEQCAAARRTIARALPEW